MQPNSAPAYCLPFPSNDPNSLLALPVVCSLPGVGLPIRIYRSKNLLNP